jgi:hypothetical protein
VGVPTAKTGKQRAATKVEKERAAGVVLASGISTVFLQSHQISSAPQSFCFSIVSCSCYFPFLFPHLFPLSFPSHHLMASLSSSAPDCLM